MQAQSLLGSVRTIDRRLEELLSATRLADDPATLDHAVAIRATLGDMAEQLRASAPFPTGREAGDDDESFFGLLNAVAGRDDPTPESVAETVEGGERVVERFEATDRIAVRGSRLVVPLGEDAAGRNWWAVLEYLRESMAALATKADRVRGRVVVDGGDGLLVTAWDSVTERLETLRDVLDRTIANGRYAGRSVGAGERPPEFVAWTADQFRREE